MSGLVFADKLGKNTVFVVGCKIDVFDLYAQHIGHGGGIDEVNVG